jgi:hypothetical protein
MIDVGSHVIAQEQFHCVVKKVFEYEGELWAEIVPFDFGGFPREFPVSALRVLTDNKYWIFLEKLRRSGETNMYGAVPYLMKEFRLSKERASSILSDWMENYKREDYV